MINNEFLLFVIFVFPLFFALLRLRKSSKINKQWFFEIGRYFMSIFRKSILLYGPLLFIFLTGCTIFKTIELSLLKSLDIHLKMFVVSWFLSFVKLEIDLTEPISIK